MPRCLRSMRFDTSQHMRMSQQMKLAPRMIQSMEFLQLPMMALQERIEQELESNIALEQVEPGSDGSLELDGEASSADADDARADVIDRRELVVGDETPGRTDDWGRLSNLESTYREAFDDERAPGVQTYRTSGERDKKMDAMANIAARGASLTDQLLDQWKFAEVDPDVAAAGERLIPYINSDGLLGSDLDTILEQNRNIPGLHLTLEGLERALHAVQQHLEPPGIAARDN